MPRPWTPREKVEKYEELIQLYSHQSKTISEIGRILHIHEYTVYKRLIKFNIPIRGAEKSCHNARILHVPRHTGDLAEFCGVVLGDGHVGLTQLLITVNVSTDASYVPYLQDLIEGLFDFRPPTTQIRGVCVNIYVTSKHLMRELQSIGLYSRNKVRDQVGIPNWIFQSTEYQRRFIRGFFDTDGSIYQLKWFKAVQMSFRNRSFPLLEGTREILLCFGYHPSRITNYSIYLTRQRDIKRYVQEIGFANDKHRLRTRLFGIFG